MISYNVTWTSFSPFVFLAYISINHPFNINILLHSSAIEFSYSCSPRLMMRLSTHCET